MRRLRALLFVTLLFPATGLPAQQPSPLQDVPTTKILAIGTLTGPRDATWSTTMPNEVRDTVGLYLRGKIDQWYVRMDGKGVVFLVNASSVEEAHSLLEALPLGRAHLMTFDLMPLGPLTPLRFLLGTQQPTTPPAAKP